MNPFAEGLAVLRANTGIQDLRCEPDGGSLDALFPGDGSEKRSCALWCARLAGPGATGPTGGDAPSSQVLTCSLKSAVKGVFTPRKLADTT